MDASRFRPSKNVTVKSEPDELDPMDMVGPRFVGEPIDRQLARFLLSTRGQLEAYMDDYQHEQSFDRIIREAQRDHNTATRGDPMAFFTADNTPPATSNTATPHRLEDHVYTTATPSGPKARKY